MPLPPPPARRYAIPPRARPARRPAAPQGARRGGGSGRRSLTGHPAVVASVDGRHQRGSQGLLGCLLMLILGSFLLDVFMKPKPSEGQSN